MDNKHFFADVDLPFHVWVREGDRWVLRQAPQAPGAEAGPVNVNKSPRGARKRGPERRAG